MYKDPSKLLRIVAYVKVTQKYLILQSLLQVRFTVGSCFPNDSSFEENGHFCVSNLNILDKANQNIVRTRFLDPFFLFFKYS